MVVVITGGSNGIGLQTALKFNSLNYNVIVLDIRENELLNNKGIIYYKCDVSNDLKVKEVFTDIKKKFKTIDILINCAGIQTSDSFMLYDLNKYKRILNTNYFGSLNCIYESISAMAQGGRILNVLSVHSSIPRKYKYAYDASKSALELTTKELALEFSDKNITINAVSFGAVNTNMNKDWIKEKSKVQETLEKVPLRIIFKPEEIAKFIVNIIENFTSYTTGSIFTIDGGRSLM